MVHHTISDFKELMVRFGIPQKNIPTIYQSIKNDTSLFTGVDEDGRVFLSLPVEIESSRAHIDRVVECREKFSTEGRPAGNVATTIFIYQLTQSSTSLFGTYNEPEVLVNHMFLGWNFRDFSHLKTLLSTGEVTCTNADAPGEWFTIALKR